MSAGPVRVARSRRRLQSEARDHGGAAELDPAEGHVWQFRGDLHRRQARGHLREPLPGRCRDRALPADRGRKSAAVAVEQLHRRSVGSRSSICWSSITAAYAIAVIHFRGRQTALYSILVTRVIPDIALIVPLFLVMRNLGPHQHAARADHHLSRRHAAVHDLHSDLLFRADPARSLQGGARRRLLALAGATPCLSAAVAAGPGRLADVRVPHQLERVPLRADADAEHRRRRRCRS